LNPLPGPVALSRRTVAANEEEHFLVISGHYRIAIGDQILDAPLGTRATVPRNTPHSWRNVAAEESRLLAILTPGGFEQIVYAVKATPPEKIRDLATAFGCDIFGPPVRRMRAQRFKDSTISD